MTQFFVLFFLLLLAPIAKKGAGHPIESPYVVIEQMECRESTRHRAPFPSILIKSLMKGR